MQRGVSFEVLIAGKAAVTDIALKRLLAHIGRHDGKRNGSRCEGKSG